MKLVNVILAIMLTSASLAAVGQTRPAPRHQAPAATQPADDPLQEAEALLQKQQYAQAEEKLLGLMPEQAKNPQAWFDLGFAQSHQGKTDASIASYKKAVEFSPTWFEATLNLGYSLAKSGNGSAAIEAFRTATRLKPTTGGAKAQSVAWLSLAIQSESGNPTEALSAYLKTAELDPENASAMMAAGRLSERTGDLKGAEEQYLKAAGLDAKGAPEELVRLYLKQNRVAEAETWLRKYLKNDPTSISATLQLVRLLEDQGKTQEAISTLEATHAAAPGDPSVAGALSELYARNKQYDKAVETLQKLLQNNPASAQLRWDLGSAQLHLHRYPEAEKSMLEALKINPRLDIDSWELAYAAQQNQHYELAIRVLDLRAQRLNETPSTYWIRAVSYDSLGSLKLAAANYKLFLAADAGKSADEEFKARHRLKAIEPK